MTPSEAAVALMMLSAILTEMEKPPIKYAWGLASVLWTIIAVMRLLHG